MSPKQQLKSFPSKSLKPCWILIRLCRGFGHLNWPLGASQVALVVTNPPANAGDVRNMGSTLGWEDPLEKGMATHSSILAWRIPRREEPGWLQSMGSHRVGHGWSDLACTTWVLCGPDRFFFRTICCHLVTESHQGPRTFQFSSTREREFFFFFFCLQGAVFLLRNLDP